MAGTTDDNTTDDYCWLGDALAGIGEDVDGEKQAEGVLCDGVNGGHIRWRCQSVTVDEKRDFQAHPPIETPPAAAYRFFWHRYEHSRVEFDRQTNCVRR